MKTNTVLALLLLFANIGLFPVWITIGVRIVQRRNARISSVAEGGDR